MKLPYKEREKFTRFCAGAVVLLVLLFMAYLFPCSLFRTTGMSTGTGRGEIISFNYDNFFLNIITLSVSAGLVYLVYRAGSGISLKRCVLIMSVWVLASGLLFVLSAKLQPSEDSFVVTFFARQAAMGDYSYYHEYFEFFPFQLGFALYEESFFRFFNMLLPGMPEGFSSLALQGMNVIFVLVCCISLVAIAYLLWESETVCKLTALLMACCIQPVLMSTFMYGNIPSLAFALASVWMFLSYMKYERDIYGFLCLVFLCFAVLLKLNSLIFVVALVIVWALCLIRKPGFRSFALLVLTIIAVLSVKTLPQSYYEARCGHEFGGGVPQLGWLAMGMHEGETCSGWYDTTYTTEAYSDAELDAEAAKKVAVEAIAARLDYFVSEPLEALRFFGRKFLSQWNEPSYQSLWNNQVRTHYSEPGFLYELVCHRAERLVLTLMTLYQQLIFLGFTLGLGGLFFRREPAESLVPLVILGGMLYHLFFEAKSQYVLGYFMLMIPVAAYGLRMLFRRLDKLDPHEPHSAQGK